jgi:O-antigen ligase
VRGGLAAVTGVGAELLLVGMLLLAPLPNGCVLEGPGDAQWQTLLAVAAFTAFILIRIEAWLRRAPFRLPSVAVPLLALLGLLAFQLVPLPLSVLETISPATASYVELANAGAAWAPISLVPQHTLLEALRLAAYIAVLILVVHRFRTMGGCVRLAIWLTIIGAGMAVLGFVQRATAPPFTLLWTWELELWGSPFGPYISKNHFAGLMELGIGAALALLLSNGADLLSRSEDLGILTRIRILGGRGGLRVLGPFLAFSVMGAALIASLSRGGWLAMGAAGVAALLWAIVRRGSRGAWRVVLVLFLGIGIAVAVLGAGNVGERFEIQERVINRPLIWRDAADLVVDFPLFGAGAGTFLYTFQPYHSFPDRRLATHAESDWVQTATGVGLVGLVLLLWAAIRFGRRVREGMAGELSPDRLFILGLVTGLLALVLHGFVDVNLQIPANGLHFTVVAGLALAASRMVNELGVLGVVDGEHREVSEGEAWRDESS